ACCAFLLAPRPPPRPTLFPYTTLFRSVTVIIHGDPHQTASGVTVLVQRTQVEFLTELRGAIEVDAERHVIGTVVHGKGIIRKSRSEEHTSELQSRENLVCRLLLENKNK